MWFAVVVVSRDVVILLGYSVIYLLVEERFPRSRGFGKCSTFFSYSLWALPCSLHDVRDLSTRG
jgi:hypothetical protein